MNPFIHTYQRIHNSQGNISQKSYPSGRHALERDDKGEPYEYDSTDNYLQTQSKRWEYKRKLPSPLREKEEILRLSFINCSGKTSKTKEPISNFDKLSCTTRNLEKSVIPSNSNERIITTLEENQEQFSNNSFESFKNSAYTLMGSNSLKLESKTTPVEPKEALKNAGILINDEKEKRITSETNSPTVPTSFILNSESRYQLKKILFGQMKKIPKEWIGECFEINENIRRYGLNQSKEGCSGIIATVQAYMLKYLMNDGILKLEEESLKPLVPSVTDMKTVLTQSLCEILWQAGENRAVLVIMNQKPMEEIDEMIHNMSCYYFSSKESLMQQISQNLSFFLDPYMNGCFLFTISVVLSKGIHRLKEEINDETKSLIDMEGFCSEELIYLLLTGLGNTQINFDTNIFNGNKLRADIGFLSLNEHHNLCQIGPNLKNPRYPIWLVSTGNSYCVLYSYQKELLYDWKAERQFILYQFEPLHSDALTKLTVGTTSMYGANTYEDNAISPLENCIRTKWKDAVIMWDKNK